MDFESFEKELLTQKYEKEMAEIERQNAIHVNQLKSLQQKQMEEMQAIFELRINILESENVELNN